MTFAILLAAGSSQRYGKDKLWEPIAGMPVWLRSYNALKQPGIAGVGIVTSRERCEDCADLAGDALFVVEGGSSRQESCLLGLRALPPEATHVLIHDAARPWASPELIGQVREAMEQHGAAGPGIPVTDTIKQVTEKGLVHLDRASLAAMQTPQGALVSWLLEAHAKSAGRELTDDLALLEAAGFPAVLVPGDPANRKVTHPGDLPMQTETRTGLGYDIHRFSDDLARPMWLGGVEFDSRPGLEGHSDADALLHAVVDALLGAARLGDIGQLYRNTDDRWKDMRSTFFLQEAGRLVREQGWEIVFVDASVVAERPKVMARRDEICESIGGALGISPDRVSVKATTNEGLGAIGRSEGVAAFAVATLSRTA